MIKGVSMENRTIKFRVWSKWQKRWAYFTLGQVWSEEQRGLYLAFCLNGERFYEFTGLKDKNGQEICEGDIVKNEFGVDEVYFNEGEFKKKSEIGSGCSIGRLGSETMEIIGNIYENPDLLTHST